MTDRGAARRDALSRRCFLALAPAAAVGLWIPSARAGPRAGGEGDEAAREHGLRVRVPRLTANGAKVPIVVEMDRPLTPGHHVTAVRVTNASDPISSKGTFHFTPGNGRVYLAFQARMHDGPSVVTAAAECNLHGPISATGPVEIAAGTGGCAGGAPSVPRTRGDDVHAPVIRIPALLERRAIRAGEVFLVQVKMRHPNRTGLAFRDGRFVPEGDPVHLESLEVLYGGERVSHFSLTSALSDDPLFTFAVLARRAGRLRVVVTNSRGQRFEGAHELPVA
jgi:predicted secreted protein